MTDNREGSVQAQARFWAVVPAAGIGSRMQTASSGVPKQYLRIGGQSILSLTLSRLEATGNLAGMVLALSAQDQWFSASDYALHTPLKTVEGGSERMHSVYNCLDALNGEAAAQDWVLVHDAVRPCVSLSDINTLMTQLANSDTGGLLAMPVSETLKRVNADNVIEHTEPRECFWLAGTPQMFRYGALKAALSQAIDRGIMVTDEAHAMELAGHTIKVIQGNSDNIKITHASDLVLAEHILDRQGTA